MKKNALIFYSRIPSKNMVGKTRLAKELENQFIVSEFARTIILDLLHAYLPTEEDSYDLIFAYVGDRSGWDSAGLNIKNFVHAEAKHLGESIKNVIDQTLIDYTKVLLVGSDALMMTKSTLLDYFNRLDDVDVVIQPVEDGGYAMIGMKNPQDFFTKIENYESRTPGYDLFNKTIELLDASDTRYFSGEPIFDLDYKVDVQNLFSSITKNGELEPKYHYLCNTYLFLQEHADIFDIPKHSSVKPCL